MSVLTKKKHVYQETIDHYDLPTANQTIVKVKAPRGNNLHDVETCTKEEFIVTMPTKFRKTVWVKRGDYLLVEPIEEGNKVKAEIVQILQRDYIKYLKDQNLWPKEFETNVNSSNGAYQIDDDLMPPSGDDEDYQSDEDNENFNEENITESKTGNYNRTVLFSNNQHNNVINDKNL